MGGAGSGAWYRWNKKAHVDDCRCLDINRMVKLGAIKNDCLKSGSWQWVDNETGEKKASISYETNTLDKNNPYVRLYYTLTLWDKKIDYKIPLSLTRPHYGGERFWFVCTVKGIRTSKLYLPAGGDIFASRQAYRLLYGSQSETSVDRAFRKKWKIVGKTKGDNFPIKPKGMHDKTFERILDEFFAQEDICLGYMAAFIQKHGGL